MDILYIALCVVLFLACAAGMEAVAWFAHKYIMHGFLWTLHKDHHVPHKGPFEKNDLFVVFFATPAIICLVIGINNGNALLISAGAGISAYGIGYTIFHDVMFHRRLRWLKIPIALPYLKRMIDAHRVHHRTPARRPGDAYGFLYAPKRYEAPVKPVKSASASQATPPAPPAPDTKD